MRQMLAPLAAMILLAACSGGRHVDKPLNEVYVMLTSMPAEANAMALATTFPGTSHYLQPDGGRLIWHFTHQGKDYGRFVAILREDGPNATVVSTAFEQANDAELSAKLGFLRKMARKAGDESVAAALEGRAVDRLAFQEEMKQMVLSDPMAAQMAAIETVGAEMDRLAPPDPCDSDDRATRERCETFERNRGSGGMQSFQ